MWLPELWHEKEKGKQYASYNEKKYNSFLSADLVTEWEQKKIK